MRYIEQLIIQQAVTDILAAGCNISVFDGEEYAIRHSCDYGAIMAKLNQTDEDILRVYRGMNSMGWVKLIYGEDGPDVIADYTMSLEELLSNANALAERFAA